MYFSKWPFGVVPEDSPTLWADRHQLKSNLDKLLNSVKQRQRSVMLGMWGYVGAGKSHTLLFFKYNLEKVFNAFIIYSPLPKQIKSFADIYKQAFIGNIDFIKFANIVGNVYSKHSQMNEYQLLEMFCKKITANWVDMAMALIRLGNAVSTGGPLNPYLSLIKSWLSGVRLSKSDLRQLGLSANLTYDSDFVKAAASIIRIITFSGDNSQRFPIVFWMVDDCHYLAELKRQQRIFAGIQQGIRELFDSCPQNLCVVFAFAARQASTLVDLVIPDLLSRMQERIHVPPLTKEESLIFVKDLLSDKRFRVPEAQGDYYPFSLESITFLVESIVSTSDLTPRNLMKALAFFVTKADEEENHPKIIGRDFVAQHMEECKELLMSMATY